MLSIPSKGISPVAEQIPKLQSRDSRIKVENADRNNKNRISLMSASNLLRITSVMIASAIVFPSLYNIAVDRLSQWYSNLPYSPSKALSFHQCRVSIGSIIQLGDGVNATPLLPDSHTQHGAGSPPRKVDQLVVSQLVGHREIVRREGRWLGSR